MIENLTTITEEETFQCEVLQNDTIKINTHTTDAYRNLVRHLNSEKFVHHTYQMKQNWSYRVVVRNLHYSITTEEITEELRRQEHTVCNIINIRHRVHKDPLSMVYVDLEPQHNNKDIYYLQYLSNMKIMAEPPNKNRTIIQYTQCQLHGHSKSYCKRPYKCVECGGNHMTTDCQKSKDTPAECVLFCGDHTANYRGCTFYRDLINARHTPTARHPGRQNITQHTRTLRTPSRLCRLTTHTPRHSRVPMLITNETTSDYNYIPSSTNSKQCSLN